MTARQQTPITEWLRRNRGAMSQVAFVADLERVTGWKLLRENYSKYETGFHTPEPETLERFVAYWASKGIEGPDLTPPPVPVQPLDPTERMAVALESIALSLVALREDMAEQAGASYGATQTLGAQLTAILERMPDAR